MDGMDLISINKDSFYILNPFNPSDQCYPCSKQINLISYLPSFKRKIIEVINNLDA